MKLHAEKRETVGTGASKQARADKKIPAVVFGKEFGSTSVLIDAKEFEDLLRELGRNAVFNIDIEGKETQVIIKNIDRSALKPEFYNVEMQAITKGQKVTVSITINIEGSEEVEEGIVTQVLNELEVEVAPADIPNEITVNVETMEIGDVLTVADLVTPSNLTVLSEDDTTVVVVSAPQLEEEPEEGSDVDADMPEPEVIGEKEDAE